MPAPATSYDLIALIRKSELVEESKLEECLGRLDSSVALALSPRELAVQLIEVGLITKFQAEQFVLGRWKGFNLGSYKILEQLGVGGMGHVFLAEHTVMKRRVAVKVLPASAAGDPVLRERFNREARAAGSLDHPNIVRVHDIANSAGVHYLVMEFVDGESLQQVVSRFGPLDVLTACHYIAQVAHGLQHAHEAGLIHRDIKPANLLLDRTGTVKILDLGLVRFFDEPDHLTREHQEKNILGTADYLAPEQAVDSHGVDIRADLYSLGATFHFLLCGQPLFPEGKAAQKLVWHQMRPPTPIRELRPDVPVELEAVLLKMLAKLRDDRYQSPMEVAEALLPWLATPLGPPPEEWMPQLSRAARDAGMASSVGPRSGGPRSSISSRSSWSGQPLSSRSSHAQISVPPSSSELSTANGNALTTPRELPRPSQVPGLVPVTVKAGRNNRLFSIVALGVAAAAAAVACYVLFIRGPRTQKTDDTNSPANGSTRLVVSRADVPGGFKSVQEALAKAKAGQRVVVAEDAWDEPLTISDATVAPGVRLEGQAPSGRPVKWSPPANYPAGQPLIAIAGATDVHIEGFVFDGADRVDDLIVASGFCPGLTVQDVTFSNFLRSAVCVRGATGDPMKPVTLRRARVAATHPVPSGLLFQTPRGGSCQQVYVTDSRFEGPMLAAVRLAGHVDGLFLDHNRFSRAADGVLFQKDSPSYTANVQVTSNTFHELKTGLRFEALPANGSANVTVRKNLFVFVPKVAVVDGVAVADPNWTWLTAPEGNVRDATSQDGVPNLRSRVAEVTIGTDPTNDTTFLRYAKDSPLTKVGSPGVPPE